MDGTPLEMEPASVPREGALTNFDVPRGKTSTILACLISRMTVTSLCICLLLDLTLRQESLTGCD